MRQGTNNTYLYIREFGVAPSGLTSCSAGSRLRNFDWGASWETPAHYQAEVIKHNAGGIQPMAGCTAVCPVWYSVSTLQSSVPVMQRHTATCSLHRGGVRLLQPGRVPVHNVRRRAPLPGHPHLPDAPPQGGQVGLPQVTPLTACSPRQGTWNGTCIVQSAAKVSHIQALTV